MSCCPCSQNIDGPQPPDLGHMPVALAQSMIDLVFNRFIYSFIHSFGLLVSLKITAVTIVPESFHLATDSRDLQVSAATGAILLNANTGITITTVAGCHRHVCCTGEMLVLVYLL